jgi:hypothetical protein
MFSPHTRPRMTLDKHQLDGIGGFSEKTLPADRFEELMINSGYSQIGAAPAKGDRVKIWWTHETFRNVETIYNSDKSLVITAYHV